MPNETYLSDELDVLKSVTPSLQTAMNDTAPEVDERFRAMLMARTGEERLIMGCAVRDSARMIVEASLRADDPQAMVQTIRKGLFLRFYGHEFDADTRAKILAAIDRAAHPASR
jgi:hypothetical protein